MKRNVVSALALVVGLSGLGIGLARAQGSGMPGHAGHPAATEPTDKTKIENAMTAAPEAVGRESTVYDWPEQGSTELRLLREGTNGWACLPDFPGSPGNDPWCMDQPSLQWFKAYLAGEEPKLTQPGLGYMLQGGSDASDTDPAATEPAPGEDWMSAPPHLMVMPAGDLDPAVYGTDHHSGRPWLMFADTPYEHLMIPTG